jgi:hypothetical protein
MWGRVSERARPRIGMLARAARLIPGDMPWRTVSHARHGHAPL